MHDKKPNLTHAVIHGAFWVYAAKYSSKLIAFIAIIILARLVYTSVIWWLQREEVIKVGLTLRTALVRR